MKTKDQPWEEEVDSEDSEWLFERGLEGAPLRAGLSRPNDANSRGNQQLIILIPERMVTAGGHQAGSPLSTSYSAGLRRKNRSELKVKAK